MILFALPLTVQSVINLNLTLPYQLNCQLLQWTFLNYLQLTIPADSSASIYSSWTDSYTAFNACTSTVFLPYLRTDIQLFTVHAFSASAEIFTAFIFHFKWQFTCCHNWHINRHFSSYSSYISSNTLTCLTAARERDKGREGGSKREQEGEAEG